MLAMTSTLQLTQYSQQLSLATGFTVQIVATIESTNSALLADAEHLPTHPEPPIALIALNQTAGRGRRGRQWLTPEEHQPPAFMASLGIRTHYSLPSLGLLPLNIGVAVVEQLRQWGCPASLKWPNDIVISTAHGSAKLGGILVETRHINGENAVIIGMGLNWFGAPAMADRLTAYAMQYATQAPDPLAVCSALLQAMHVGWQRTADQTPCAFSSVDALYGQSIVSHNSHNETIHGIAMGINAQGHLGLQTDAGLMWLHSGEVSVREHR
jgi:BirA family transcriptional regulator, biotin operon repressor / biotin---[acetyl-CoA-carboxylase] ligase